MRRIVGVVVVAAGLWLATFPFTSVWAVTGTAIDQVPEVAAERIATDRNWLAMFSGGFTLATRSYQGATADEVEQAFRADGFDALVTQEGERWWIRECCGEYDAVWVRVDSTVDGGSRAVISVYDEDIQATWPFISGLGVLLSLIGLGLVVARTGSPTLAEATPQPVASPGSV